MYTSSHCSRSESSTSGRPTDQPISGIQTIPVELLSAIFSHLKEEPRDSEDALLRCSEVCKSFRAICLPMLFRHIRIEYVSEGVDRECRICRQLPIVQNDVNVRHLVQGPSVRDNDARSLCDLGQFLELLSAPESAHIAPLIFSLHLSSRRYISHQRAFHRQQANPNPSLSNYAASEVKLRTFLRIMQRLSALQNLTLTNFKIDRQKMKSYTPVPVSSLCLNYGGIPYSDIPEDDFEEVLNTLFTVSKDVHFSYDIRERSFE